MVRYIVEAREPKRPHTHVIFAPVALNLRPHAPYTYLAFDSDDNGTHWFDTYAEALAVCIRHEEAARAFEIAEAGGVPEWDYFTTQYVDVSY